MDLILWLIELLAVLAASLSGSLEARSKQMDLVGTYFVALATALGGGTLRDLLLDRHPVFWIADSRYALYVLIAAVSGILIVRRRQERSSGLALSIGLLDALGLALFSLAGATYAQAAGTGPIVGILIGVSNGIFGGVVRDVLCNEIPSVFRRNTQLYATCAFAGCVVYFAGVAAGWTAGTSFVAGAATVTVSRVAAIRYNLGLPV